MPKLKTSLVAAAALTMIAVVFSTAGSAYAHGSGMSRDSRDGSSHLTDRPGSDGNQSKDQGPNQNLQIKLTGLDKTGKDHSIFQGLRQWEMKHERTKVLAEIVRLITELRQLSTAGKLGDQQFQELVKEAGQLQAKFLANGGTNAEIGAVLQKLANAQ